ncbi:rhamnulokinase [Dysgonomonas macrotermitis]|uniref:Rhamnulokinase n=1 Tax=Dysgonomonas macrotermitis TaxID=1346286 RepID=A0A1M4TNQ0_9BACT|nr:rhamnulokinase family protein [Dysgonomonas macrotermitis]SHE46091.1 rhamnulokinase [Dysgonomonas macrotermitis]
MKNIHHFFAFDLGATSGRSILATIENDRIELKELTRFPNKIIRVHDKYYWDIYALFDALKDGLKVVASQSIKIDAIGIDTWGVDFVYLGKDGSVLSQPRSYRDPYTEGAPEEYFNILPKKEVYDLTGIQIMNFNSIFQLFAAKKEKSSALESAADILFMPDALSYMLTGKKVCEYTIASTSQLLNPRTKNFEAKLFDAIGISPSLMQPIVMPGEVIGYVTESIMKECGIDRIPVIAVAGHDTGSAVAAVPAENEKFAYLSSGTWSLMGIEVDDPIITNESFDLNFTNEGGVNGTTRFLKNITGMWLLEQCRKEWEAAGQKYTYPEIVELSNSIEGFQSMIDPDDPSFANPESMSKAICTYCQKTGQKQPQSHAEFIRCIFDSLALKYRFVLGCLQKVAPFKIEKLHVIGGGSQNRLLNQATANSIGMPVVAGPSEATAIGNVMMQAKGAGLIDSLQDIRKVISNSVTPEVFQPCDTEVWNEAYNKFFQLLQIK